MEPRSAAKGLITTLEGDKFLFVAGQSGRPNLPGGGLKPGETNLQALLREMAEEIAPGPEQILAGTPQEAFPLEGDTTSASGIAGHALWTVFRGRLVVPLAELYIPDQSETTEILSFTREECRVHPAMSELAKRAVRLGISS